MAFRIDENVCVGCGGCAFTCLFGAISAPEGYRPIKKVTIIAEKCKGCSLCSRVCKAGAPAGKIKEPFEINQEKCFKCGVCASKCKFDAIEVEYE